jgi:hypothetical protein
VGRSSSRALLFPTSGATRLVQPLSAAYAPVLAEYNRLVDAAFAGEGGTVSGTAGGASLRLVRGCRRGRPRRAGRARRSSGCLFHPYRADGG